MRLGAITMQCQDENSEGWEPRDRAALCSWGPLTSLGAPKVDRACMSGYQIHRLQLLQRGQLPRLQLTKLQSDSTLWERNVTLPEPLPNAGQPSRAGSGETDSTGLGAMKLRF